MLFSETTKTISLLSHYLGVAMSPKPDIVTLKKVKLLQYRADTIVATLFTDEGMMKIIHEMSKEKSMWDSLISKALKICQEAFFSPHGDLFISGLSGVLDLPDFADLQKIKELSRAIEDKHTIIKLIDKLSEFGGVQIIIGSENSLDEMKDFSMVVSACKDDNQSVGAIGIIGPTRMDYPKAISIVDTTARFITKMLSER